MTDNIKKRINIKTLISDEKILSEEKEALQTVCETFALLLRWDAALAGLLADIVCPTGDPCIKGFVVVAFGQQNFLQLEVVVLVVLDLLVQCNLQALLL
jgi:hypothetical protein